MSFASDLVAWQRVHGRNDLPWQASRDPYRIWVSEIMLQQTHVATVIPYYERFMARFPDVAALGDADPDDVLALWSGLGYYSRARNLHRAAAVIRDTCNGQFPRTFGDVAELPGIGRSTAAAIVAFAYGARHAILDGNVKRVLARVRAIPGFPGDKATADALWRAAESLLPDNGIEGYTQGLMDLGATVCLRSRPKCLLCPVSAHCTALREGRVDELPAPRPRKVLPHRNTVMLVIEHRGALLMEKRPAPGIWGGLWCFPEVAVDEDAAAASAQRYGAEARAVTTLPDVEHGFTHFTLTISPRRIDVACVTPTAAEGDRQWVRIEDAHAAAIPAPVRRILGLLSP